MTRRVRGPGGVRFLVGPGPNPEFWDHFSTRRWETRTLDLIDRCVTPETTVIDIGAWIGPITLYATARGAARVWALEPDPVAFEALQRNVALNPDLSARIETVRAAATEKTGPVRMAARTEPGDSTSSILRDGGTGSWVAEGLEPAELLRVVGGRGPFFVKLDVEGYEYRLLPGLLEALAGRAYTLHVSTHPERLWASIPGRAPFRRVVRRLRMIRTQLRLVRSLTALPWAADASLQPLRWRALLWPLLRGKPLTPDGVLTAGTRASDFGDPPPSMS